MQNGSSRQHFSIATQGCPIGIPKNPEISGSSGKSSLGAAEEVHSARAKHRESKVRGGGSSLTRHEKIRRFVQKSDFFRRIPRSRKCNGGGVVTEPSKNKSVDSAIHRCFVCRLKQAIQIRRERIFP